MDFAKFIPSNDFSILERMEKEGQAIPVGSFEDYLNLEPTDAYKNNKERLERIERDEIQWDEDRKRDIEKEQARLEQYYKNVLGEIDNFFKSDNNQYYDISNSSYSNIQYHISNNNI